MPTITIDLPDNLNVPADWDAQRFFVSKMYEAGFLAPASVPQTIGTSQLVFAEPVKEYVPMKENPDSWFTPEQIAQAKENRRRLEEEWAKNPPPLSREEFRQVLLNGPVATEEEIQALEEIQEMRKQWKLPW